MYGPVHFNPESTSEYVLAETLRDYRGYKLRMRASADVLADALKPKSLLPQGVKILANKGFNALTLAEYEQVKKYYNDSDAYQFVYSVYDRVIARYAAKLTEFNAFIRDNASLADDDIRRSLYEIARDHVLPSVEQAGSNTANTSISQLRDLTQILTCTQASVLNPQDKNNVRAYARMNDRLQGKVMVSEYLASAATLFFSALMLTAAMASVALAVTITPIFLVPAVIFSFSSMASFVSGMAYYEDAERKREARYDAGANISSLFYNGLKKKSAQQPVVAVSTGEADKTAKPSFFNQMRSKLDRVSESFVSSLVLR
jgi:hypothetical protein